MKNQILTQIYLKSILYYNSYSGYWTWKVNKGKFKKGKQYAGCKHYKGYLIITIDGKQYPAHVLAYFYQTGKWPENEIDHKDNNKSNNIFSNLREATRSQNMANTPKPKNNSSGYKGVSWNEKLKKYKTQIQKDKKVYYLGYYNCPTKAALIRDKKDLELNGEFALLNFPRKK